MFAFQLKKNAAPFTDKEDKFVKEMVVIFRDHCQREGAIFHQLDVNKYHFFWSPYMAEHQDGLFGGIMGCWDPFTRYKVFMIPRSQEGMVVSKSSFYNGDDKSIEAGSYILESAFAATLIHELTHAWQFSVNPFLWFINRLWTLFTEYIPGLKKMTIEYDADTHISNNEDVDEFFKQLGTAYHNVGYIRRMEVSLERKLKENDPEEDIQCAKDQVMYAKEEFDKHPKWMREAAIELFNIMV